MSLIFFGKIRGSDKIIFLDEIGFSNDFDFSGLVNFIDLLGNGNIPLPKPV